MAKNKRDEAIGCILINKKLHDRIKIKAIMEGTTIRELTERILDEYCPEIIIKQK